MSLQLPKSTAQVCMSNGYSTKSMSHLIIIVALHRTIYNNNRIQPRVIGHLFAHFAFHVKYSLPDANPERTVAVQPYRRYVLEHGEHFQLSQLAYVQVGDPKVRVFVPRHFHLARTVVQDPDARVIPIHVQEHVQRYFLSTLYTNIYYKYNAMYHLHTFHNYIYIIMTVIPVVIPIFVAYFSLPPLFPIEYFIRAGQ